MSMTMVEKVNTTLRGNRRFTISELSLEFPQVSRSVIYDSVREPGLQNTVCQMGAKNVNRRTQAEMPGCSSSIFAAHQIEGDQCFDHGTGDEMWISYTNIESKRQSMQWRHSSSPKAKKFKEASSVKKIMATIFWDRKGILLIDFLERGLTINANAYCET